MVGVGDPCCRICLAGRILPWPTVMGSWLGAVPRNFTGTAPHPLRGPDPQWGPLGSGDREDPRHGVSQALFWSLWSCCVHRTTM